MGIRPTPKNPQIVSSLVGDADDGPFVGFGKLAARRRGEIMFVDGLGDDGIFAGEKGVFAPHDPLQFGEFADHLGIQIGLGEQRRPIDTAPKAGVVRIGSSCGDPGGELPETHDLFIGGAQKGMEDDFPEILDALLEGDLPVRPRRRTARRRGGRGSPSRFPA